MGRSRNNEIGAEKINDLVTIDNKSEQALLKKYGFAQNYYYTDVCYLYMTKEIYSNASLL